MTSKILVGAAGVLIALLSVAAENDTNSRRFVQMLELGKSFTAVVAEGDCEPRSIGTYAVRVYRNLNVGDYVTGVIRVREGFVATVSSEQSDAARPADLLVRIETAGSGAYRRVDRFHFDGLHLTLQDSTKGTEPGPAKNRQILQGWDGDYPVLALNRLPKGQRNAPVGYIGDVETFNAVWQAFMPGTVAPKVDFAADLIVFARNIRFYNSTSIASVKVADGVVEVIAIETMSSLPIRDKVSFAMAVVSREGARSLKTGNKLLPILGGKKE